MEFQLLIIFSAVSEVVVKHSAKVVVKVVVNIVHCAIQLRHEVLLIIMIALIIDNFISNCLEYGFSFSNGFN